MQLVVIETHYYIQKDRQLKQIQNNYAKSPFKNIGTNIWSFLEAEYN